MAHEWQSTWARSRQSSSWVKEEFLSPPNIGQSGSWDQSSASQRKNNGLGVEET